MAILIALDLSIDRQREILKKNGYCFSESSAADMTVLWFLKTYPHKDGRSLLIEINETLEKMGLPLLMTRIK